MSFWNALLWRCHTHASVQATCASVAIAWQAMVFVALLTPLGIGDEKSPTILARPLEADEVAQLEPMKLKQLVIKSQDQIEVLAKLDGVLLVNIRLGKADDRQQRPVILEGRIRDPQQRSLAAKVVTRAMESESFWNTSDDEFVVNPDKLVVTEPSAEIAAKSLAIAIEHFVSGRYEQADEFLTKALVESHDREPIHYWKVATSIALRQTDRAERRLEVLIRSNPKGSDAVAGKLQRLQGNYRRALSELEQKILLKSRSGVDVKSK